MAKRRRGTRSVDRRMRELELRRQRNMETAKKLMIVVVLVAIVVVAYLALRDDEGQGPATAEGLTVNSNGEVEIPLSEISGDASYYKYDASGVEVRFFALMGKDGDPRIAFDACDVCYENKRGYRQEGDDMVCNNCGNRYASAGIGTKNLQGGCWPSYLPMKLEGGKVLIKAQDITAKRYMFD